MASAKAQDALQRRKEARQKKMLIGLAPLLLLMLAWQGPGIVKQLTGGGTPPPVPTTAAPTSTAPTDPTTAAAPTTAGGAAPVVAVSVSGLADTDSLDAVGPGQLIAFDRFLGKDPFKQQVVAKDPAAGAPPATGTNPPPPSNGGNGGNGGNPPTFNPGSPSATSAILDINDSAETVDVQGTFPESDPIFRLASVSSSSVKIGLVSGKFSNGKKTITVRRGKSVTLVSQPDGVRYVIKFVSVPS
jgi:hypothetical protein